MINILRELYQNSLPYESRLRLYKIRHPFKYKRLRTTVYPSSKGDFSLRPFDEHRCIFIHITKTGGTSIAQSLFGYLPYHYTAIDYRVIYGAKTFRNYFKFAFVRNPWDRLYSAYKFLKAGGWNDKDRLWANDNLSQFEDFNSFVREWLNEDNIQKHAHFWPQHQFICDNDKHLLVDYLGYFETFQDDFTNIARRLGIDKEIGHHNASPGQGYHEIYAPDARDIVADVYAADIDLFGYNFAGIQNRVTVDNR